MAFIPETAHNEDLSQREIAFSTKLKGPIFLDNQRKKKNADRET